MGPRVITIITTFIITSTVATLIMLTTITTGFHGLGSAKQPPPKKAVHLASVSVLALTPVTSTNPSLLHTQDNEDVPIHAHLRLFVHMYRWTAIYCCKGCCWAFKLKHLTVLCIPEEVSGLVQSRAPQMTPINTDLGVPSRSLHQYKGDV